MNIEELRDQLEQLAGPVPRATSAARAAVGTRVRHARRRRNLLAGGTSVLAAALVVAIVAVGIGSTGGSVKVRTTSPSATTAPTNPQCRFGAKVVPPNQVPAVVSAWNDGRGVIGGGALWTARRQNRPIHDGSIYRLKIGWYAIPFGLPTITARRLDGPGRATGDANQAINEHGKWVASAIELPSVGCWAITARYRHSTITFRELIGAPPEPLAIGTITGVLEEVGGPAPGAAHGLAGTVNVTNNAPSAEVPGCPPAALDVACAASLQVVTDASGHFRVDVPAGEYTVNGYSPQYLDGNGGCGGGSHLRVETAQTTPVEVVCPIR
jgi:hypothetical protein